MGRGLSAVPGAFRCRRRFLLKDTSPDVLLTGMRTVAAGESLSAYLHLSNGTVKTHIGRPLSKLRAPDRAQLVISAYESGLVSAARRPAGA